MVLHGCPHDYLDASRYSSPLPIIGLYVAAASLLCFLGMAIDTFRSFQQRKLWFPCKYYSLNAATLTVLAVATKLPVDLSSPMPSLIDQLTKLTGSIMICVSMGFFMPSLGNMKGSELLSNLIAMSIMAITVVVNICIQIGTGVIFAFLVEHVIIMACILALLVILWFSSLSFAIGYREMCDMVFLGVPLFTSSPTFEETKERLSSAWWVAHSSNPQYAFGRSSNCILVSIVCGISITVLLQAILRSFTLDNSSFCDGVSDYGFSTWVVVATQICAIVTAGFATTTRWFVISFHASPKRFTTWKDTFKVEDFYLRWLRLLKSRHLLHSHDGFLLRMFRGLKMVMIDLLITSQKVIVMTGKLMCFSSVWCAFLFKKFLVCLSCNEEWLNGHASHESTNSFVNMMREEDLLPWIRSNFRKEQERWMNKWERNVPTHLEQLLSKWPNTGTVDLDFPVSLFLIMIVRIIMLLSPSNGEHTQLLVNAISEGLEMVFYIEQNIGGLNSFSSRKMSPISWLSMNDPDHWCNKELHGLNIDLSSINLPQFKEILGKLNASCHELRNLFNQRNRYFDDFEASILQITINMIESFLPLEHVSNPIDVFEDIVCMLLRASLKNLPLALNKELTNYYLEISEEKLRRGVFFLSKVQKLQDHLVFNWQEIRENPPPFQ